MNLLLRFYDPQAGDITLDGASTKSLNIRYLRAQMGYVGQEPVLFTGTVADNIAYGIPPAELAGLSGAEVRTRVVAAAQLANAHDFISGTVPCSSDSVHQVCVLICSGHVSEFPSGYDTDVGSNGVAMSGGQKQRIAIARALVKKPAVLLLDEATSALDAASERVVQESIDKLQQSNAQTTIVIAHRLSTIRNADKIAVVQDGVIAELGRHDELIARGGIYKELVGLQMQGEAAGDKEGEGSGDMGVEQAGEGAAGGSSKDTGGAGEKAGSSASLVTKTVDGAPVAVAAGPAEPELTKAEIKALNAKVYALIFTQARWMLLALLGASIFGSIFPLWGLILAKTQNLFYYTDTGHIRSESANVAVYFILLGVACQVGAFFQFWAIAQVGERVSMQLRGNYCTTGLHIGQWSRLSYYCVCRPAVRVPAAPGDQLLRPRGERHRRADHAAERRLAHGAQGLGRGHRQAAPGLLHALHRRGHRLQRLVEALSGGGVDLPDHHRRGGDADGGHRGAAEQGQGHGRARQRRRSHLVGLHEHTHRVRLLHAAQGTLRPGAPV